MSTEFLKVMWIDDWIAFLKIKKSLMDYTDDELSRLRAFVKTLDNNDLLDFANRFNKINSNYKTFLNFIWSLFQEDDTLAIFRITRRYESLKMKEEAFLYTADRVRNLIQKKS